MKQSNFAETYVVNSTDGINGGVPTSIRSGSVRGNVVVAHAPESKKTGLGETKVRKTTTHERSKQSPSAQSSSKTSTRTMKTGSSSYDRVGDYNGMNIGYNKMGSDIDVDSLDSYSRDSLVEKPKRKMVVRYVCSCDSHRLCHVMVTRYYRYCSLMITLAIVYIHTYIHTYLHANASHNNFCIFTNTGKRE